MDAITPPPLASSVAAGNGAEDLDIVILHRKELKSSLDPWRDLLKSYNLITISLQDGNAAGKAQVEDEIQALDRRSYTMADVKRALGSEKSAAAAEGMARSFALLVSSRKYVAFLDADACAPAKVPATGELIDPFKQHLCNLQTPSTPYFFNTLYDPYRPGTDFVRGYPFSLRTGVSTAISHGLWLDSGKESPRYVDLVLTVPRNVFFGMRGFNVALDRELIGAAMFLGASEDPICRDFWAGFCAKLICDHLGLGVKSGLPYVALKQSDQADKQANDQIEEMHRFFQGIQMPAAAKSVVDCYEEIVNQIKSAAPKLATAIELPAIEAWLAAWKKGKSAAV